MPFDECDGECQLPVTQITWERNENPIIKSIKKNDRQTSKPASSKSILLLDSCCRLNMQKKPVCGLAMGRCARKNGPNAGIILGDAKNNLF